MSMPYVYLNWSLLLLLIWGLVFLAHKGTRRKMLTLSLATMPLGLTEPLFYPAYWFPPTLFDLAAKTGFDLESLIFSFAVGGLASSLYGFWHPHRDKALPASLKAHPRHRFHHLALATPFLVFVPLYMASGINPIYSAIAAMTAGGAATILCRPDLWRQMVLGALIFGGFYFVFFATMDWFHPAYVALFWNLDALSGVLLAGVPLEELLFALSLGMMWSGLYEHFLWQYPQSTPRGRP